jgi:hypothetical protein
MGESVLALSLSPMPLEKLMELAEFKLKLTSPQILLGAYLKELGFTPLYEVEFCEGRKWRFDVAISEEKEGSKLNIGFEVNGGKWSQYGHRSRGKQLEQELEKLNVAQCLGWIVLQFTNEFVLSGEAKTFLREWLC